MTVQATSMEEFYNQKPNLAKSQKVIYDAICTLGTPTNLEISKWKNIPINQVTPRTNELVKKRYVVQVEKRQCSVSGKNALTWRAV